MSGALGLLLASGAALVVFATLAAALADASRTRLEARLRRRARPEWLAVFDRHQRDYALVAGAAALVALLCAWTALAAWLQRVAPHAGRGMLPLAGLLGSLLLGLALPRAVARYRGEALLALLLPPLDLLRRLGLPVLLVADWCDEIIRRLCGAPAGGERAEEELGREILDIVSEAQQSGAVGATQTRVIRSVIDLSERTVGQIMTPRTEIIAVDVGATFDEARQSFVAGGHSRTPVFEGTIDNVLGMLYAKDLLSVNDATAFSIRSLMRPVPFIPETKGLAELLREFQTSRVHVAIVLDEYGGTAGLVTFEDILEELVGDIADEHEGPTPQSIRRIDDRTADVDARVRVDELNAALNLSLPEADAYDTVAGLVLSRLGRIPLAGETLHCDNVHIRVVEADDRRISRLRVQTGAASA
ncbi:MAG: hemolysin family protein [Phycisphaerae bacterium]